MAPGVIIVQGAGAYSAPGRLVLQIPVARAPGAIRHQGLLLDSVRQAEVQDQAAVVIHLRDHLHHEVVAPSQVVAHQEEAQAEGIK